MSCLLCLRNEGFHFANESSDDLEILLGLLKLPKMFSENLEGNQCCSLCRVKLQFVGVIKQEISILNQKLKCFEEEVKEIFMDSFNETIKSNDTREDELTVQARSKLLLQLQVKVKEEEVDQEDESPQEGLHVTAVPIKSPWRKDFNYQIENPISDPFEEQSCDQVEESEIYVNSGDLYETVQSKVDSIESNSNEHNFTPFESFHTIKLESKSTEISIEENSQKRIKRSSSSSNSPDFNSSQIESSQQEFPEESLESKSSSLQFPTYSLKLETESSQLHFTSSPSTSKSIPPLSASRLNTKPKMRVSICRICEPKVEFRHIEDYEEHLNSFHPTRPYSKCPTCKRIISEDKIGTNVNLKKHMRRVHTEIRRHKCEHCDATFKSLGPLRIHREVHLNRQILTCELCNTKITGERNLKTHLKKQHDLSSS